MSRPPKPLHYRIDNVIDSAARTDICLDELLGRRGVGERSRCGNYSSAGAHKPQHDCFANASRTTGNQNSFTLEFGCLSRVQLIPHMLTGCAQLVRLL